MIVGGPDRTVPGQLEMIRPHLEYLPELAPTAGCALRSYQRGDEIHWARIMNDCIGENWSADRCLEELVTRPEFQPDGCFFATANGKVEGTATSWRREALGSDIGYVHMVGVSPASRGRGLGLLVTLATLHFFRLQGRRLAVLNTDDWRLPAIGVYLKLGFEPVLFNDEHAERWAAIGEQLAARAADAAPDARRAGGEVKA